MAKYPIIGAGMSVTAQMLSDMQMPAIITTDTAGLTNSTTLTNDTQLLLPVLAVASYMFEVVASFSAVSALNCDLKTDWQVPAGSTGYRSRVGSTASATAGSFSSVNETNMQLRARGFSDPAIYQMTPLTGTSFGHSIYETGIVHVGATAGHVRLRWAMNTAQATTLQRLPFAFMRATRIG